MLFLTVGHLPRELSQIAKFILNRGVKVIATLTSTNFCRSHLVQGGLEIACKVTVKIPAAIKKPHDFGSIQRIGKRLLHGTYSWGNLGSFLAIILHDSPVQTQKFPKDILCRFYLIPHLVIQFAIWVITALREMILAGTKFHGMFMCCIKLSRRHRGNKVQSSSKRVGKNGGFLQELTFVNN